MMETLDSLNTSQFKLVVRLSDQKTPRWDKKYLDEQISKSVQKIWVCAPPLMEENFDKYLEEICS